MSVLIKGGRVVTATDSTVADVFVEGERISLIGSSLDVQAATGVSAADQEAFLARDREAAARGVATTPSTRT